MIPNDNNAADIVLSLSHSQAVRTNDISADVKKPYLIISNLTPPIGVPSGCMREIKLRLGFSSGWKKKRLKRSLSHESTFEDMFATTESKPPVTDVLSCSQLVPNLTSLAFIRYPLESVVHSRTSSSNSFESMLEDGDDSRAQWKEQDSPVCSGSVTTATESPMLDQADASSLVQIQSGKRKTVGDLALRVTQSHCACAALADAAVRAAICQPSPGQSSGQVSLIRYSHGRRLAQISPAVFSPGYLEVCNSQDPINP